ncbi:hypothetical protein V8F20_000974 [Naviculisporaceae sp. PSN 640]
MPRILKFILRLSSKLPFMLLLRVHTMARIFFRSQREATPLRQARAQSKTYISCFPPFSTSNPFPLLSLTHLHT